MIEEERIEAIKQGVDLTAVIRSRGIELKRNGKGYVGRCPFHDDQNPSLSVNTEEKLWKCFGCGAGGDAIRFIELFDKVGFREAVEKLSGSAPAVGGAREPSGNGRETSKTEPLPATEHAPAGATTRQANAVALSARHIKLLSRVIEFYHSAFAEDGRAGQYLASRGITDNGLLASFKIGFANGTLLNVLPADGEVTCELKEIGVLNERGAEHFYGCVTFPLYDMHGNPAGIYGRRIDGMEKAEGPPHLYLPGPRRGLFNRQAAKTNREIILTEAVIDSLTLIHAGIHNTIPCYGTNGLTSEHIGLLRQCETMTLYLAFDGDEAGEKAMETLSARLQSEGLRVYPVQLPAGEDVNSLFSLTADPNVAKQRFIELMDQANPAAKAAVKEKEEGATAQSPTSAADGFTTTDYGFTGIIGGRRYEVRGITRADTKLKATVKGIGSDAGKKRFHVDTVDFYSARSRAFLVKGLADLFGQPEEVIIRDLERLMELTEGWREVESAAPAAPPEMTDAAKEQALAFLKNPALFEEVLADFETLGYTGEEMNKLLCYLAAVSRKIEEPLSVMIQSRSAAGKSFLQDTVLSMVPEEDFVKYTRLTDQALFYKDSGSLKHKILAVEELDGMNGAIYSIRSIQSSKKITIAYTGKDPVTGRLRTEENTVEGPLSVFITTTQVDIDGETASRFVFLAIDESREMTERILAKQRENYTREGIIRKLEAASILEKHRNANRLLRPLGVINPYAHLLTFTSRSLRARRDHIKYQNLILAVSFLFQQQRKTALIEHGGKTVECVLVTLADVARANEIAGVILGRSLDELSPSSRKLLMLIREMSEKASREDNVTIREYRFNRRRIREFSGWSDFQVRTHIAQLEELEYLYAATGKRGKEYVYELVYAGGGEDGKPFLIGLIDIAQLRKKAEEAGIGDE
jgi:DNA primase